MDISHYQSVSTTMTMLTPASIERGTPCLLKKRSLIFGASRPLPKKTIWRKNKNCFVPDEKIPWPTYCRYTTRIMEKKKKMADFSDGLGLRSSVISETVSDEKCHAISFSLLFFFCPIQYPRTDLPALPLPVCNSSKLLSCIHGVVGVVLTSTRIIKSVVPVPWSEKSLKG